MHDDHSSHDHHGSDQRHTFSGRKIDPPTVSPNMTVPDLIKFYGSTGYNARRLAEAAEILQDMIDTGSTVCLTLAGAMTPIGMGKTISEMIEAGFIDWIVATGANVYHDLHFAYGLPVKQGHFDVDDDVLYAKQIVRIYDVYIKELETLQAQDLLVQKDIAERSAEIPKNASTADIAYALGKAAKENAKYPDKSFLVKAYEHKVPVYMPAIGDSSIGLNMLPLLLEGRGVFPNTILDVAESAAILWKSKKSGGLELGGGVPKNFFQQTGPALYQILKIKEGGQDYLIQMTDARPDTGGLSGATLQEGKSWGKIKTSHRGNVIVYGDSSVYFPLLCSYALSVCKPRKQKEIYSKKDKWVQEMKKIYFANNKKEKSS
ncbi:MAG TPA: deoxyhypusine synthase [Nitrososphaera sp.]|nr:deoxyhypusine synthase [uncultured Nitrososphaera sp.]